MIAKRAPDRAPPGRLIARLAWFAAFWLLGVAAVGGAAAIIHWALAPR